MKTKQLTATDVIHYQQEYGVVYDEADSIGEEVWKNITQSVVLKYCPSVSIEPNPNELFRRRKNPKPLYVKPPIGKKPDWL
jgi:hypothetical protein